MKLTNLTTMLKSRMVRGAAIATVAAAALTAAPAAQAQRFFFGVHVGPRYVAPYPAYVTPAPYYAPAPVVVYGGPAYGYGYWDRFHAWHRDERWHRGFDGRWHR